MRGGLLMFPRFPVRGLNPNAMLVAFRLARLSVLVAQYADISAHAMRCVWLHVGVERAVVLDCPRAMCRPGESYSDVSSEGSSPSTHDPHRHQKAFRFGVLGA